MQSTVREHRDQGHAGRIKIDINLEHMDIYFDFYTIGNTKYVLIKFRWNIYKIQHFQDSKDKEHKIMGKIFASKARSC